MSKIEIIGLGAGDINQLPVGIYKRLTNAEHVIFTRTLDHPVIKALQEEGIQFESFDQIYEDENDFEKVYKRIVSLLLEKAREESAIIYTVPGHPMLAERTVKLLLEESDVEVEILGGQSYLDDLFTSIKIDPIEGFQFVDATSFSRKELNYRGHLIFCQVYDQFIASRVKLTLLEDLPPDYQVVIVEAAGSSGERIEYVPLEDLDRQLEVNNLTSVYVPPVPNELLNHTFTNLREVMKVLRSPEGCPWDQEQTHESLKEHSIEEIYELIEAIDQEDDEGIVEELGDILMHVVLHSQIGEDNGYFTVDDVIKGITDKMIYRHPHVFADVHVQSTEEVTKNWELLKQKEKGEKRQSILDGVPQGLPALAKAFKLQKKAAKTGFDWDDVHDIWDKLDEEITEVKEAITAEQQEEIEKEFGDVLFVLANLTRYYNINPEIALMRSNNKFTTRFQYIEEQLKKNGKDIHKTTLKEMDHYWNQAKERE
ncbi:nucleoside triphosphate pyrophosphohydrolase [Oceanobacillus piezotolerans]|uniref:Nucleoside triphosphate pyrophosphohydrolase n=1 Tax=Oceanobacillus piezotolerans TaxID=2448030 RepID=A0A498DA17_9BACI|nr:nucleoside triphosphate pyrophosphohydrolase [Oceanobacillus piezotolerans]RLL41678.1 nucleoside triphosphate pyrophosphohydrolase [Oceanobacillus piezotolerans]